MSLPKSKDMPYHIGLVVRLYPGCRAKQIMAKNAGAQRKVYNMLAGTNNELYGFGQAVAKNLKPREEQKYPAPSQWFEERVRAVGRKQTEKERSQLKAAPSFRCYNTAGRMFPGAMFLYHDKHYVMTGQMTNGQYYRAAGAGSRNFPAKQCKLLTHNTGLVYL